MQSTVMHYMKQKPLILPYLINSFFFQIYLKPFEQLKFVK